MSRLAAPMERVEIPPLEPLSRYEIFALMRDDHDAEPIIKEWCRVSRIMLSMLDVLGEEHNQDALSRVSDGLVKDLDEFFKQVAYAKCDEEDFDSPSEEESLSFIYDISAALDVEPEFEKELRDLDLGESWLVNRDPEMVSPTKEELEIEEMAVA